MVHLRLLLIGSIVSLAMDAAAARAVEPLKLAIQPVISRVRSHAPIPIEITLEWPKETLLEGELELTLVDDNQVIGRHHIRDLVLSMGQQRFKVLLPPLRIRNTLAFVAINARFFGTQAAKLADKQVAMDLGTFEVRVPELSRREFVVGVPHAPGQLLAEGGLQFIDALPLDQFNPDPSQRLELSTYAARAPVDEFPSTPLGYLGYDLLVLEGEGFTLLRESQLDAIAAWVEGGGSACLVANRPLSLVHAAFLNRIAGSKRERPFVVDEQGRLISGRPDAEQKWSLHRPELGRVLLLFEPLDLEQDAKSDAWRQAVAFLWKMRASQFPEIASTGKWKYAAQRGVSASFEVQKPFAPQPIVRGTPLRELLIPAKIKGMPMGVVAAILAVFLLAIAPGDYLLLGWLHARRYTWLLFTVLSLGFAFFTVHLAQGYMGKVDYRTALVFVDLAAGNKAARTNRYELQFTATQKTVPTEFRNALYVAMDRRVRDLRELRNFASRQRGAPSVFDPLEDEEDAPGVVHEPPTYEGRPPTAFTILQPMRQWSPRLNRQTTFGGNAPRPAFDFDSVDAAQLQSAEGRNALHERILQAEPNAAVLLFHGVQVHFDVPEAQPAATRSGADPLDRQFLDVVKDVSRRPESGLFALVSQISPTGNTNYEDLALLDSSDPKQWLLVVLVTGENDRIVYRRLYEEGR